MTIRIVPSILIPCFLAPVLALSGSILPPGVAAAEEPVWQHATAMIGEPKYAEGFARFDYVNPDAPKGGTLKLSEEGTFDSFNPVQT